MFSSFVASTSAPAVVPPLFQLILSRSLLLCWCPRPCSDPLPSLPAPLPFILSFCWSHCTPAAAIGSGCSRTGAAPGESSVARVSCFCEQACHPQAAVLRRLQLHLMLCRLPPSYSRTKTASLARPCAFLSRSTSKSPPRSSSFLSPCDFSFREATHRLLHPSTPRSPSRHSTAHAPWPPHSSLSPLALSCAAAFLSLCALPLLRLVVECLCEIRMINKTFARCTQT